MNTHPQGWQCPCCKVVYAPSVMKCECSLQQDPNTKIFPDVLMYHENGVTYFWPKDAKRFVPQSHWNKRYGWFSQSREVHQRAQQLTLEFHDLAKNADLNHIPQ